MQITFVYSVQKNKETMNANNENTGVKTKFDQLILRTSLTAEQLQFLCIID